MIFKEYYIIKTPEYEALKRSKWQLWKINYTGAAIVLGTQVIIALLIGGLASAITPGAKPYIGFGATGLAMGAISWKSNRRPKDGSRTVWELSVYDLVPKYPGQDFDTKDAALDYYNELCTPPPTEEIHYLGK